MSFRALISRSVRRAEIAAASRLMGVATLETDAEDYDAAAEAVREKKGGYVARNSVLEREQEMAEPIYELPEKWSF